ncbi:vacuolar sorting protein [Trifolium repens]|nr:vacuolar sorting protein [Trifolium repens]
MEVFTVELLELQRGVELHARQLEIMSLLLELVVAEDGLSSMLLGLVIHMSLIYLQVILETFNPQSFC